MSEKLNRVSFLKRFTFSRHRGLGAIVKHKHYYPDIPEVQTHCRRIFTNMLWALYFQTAMANYWTWLLPRKPQTAYVTATFFKTYISWYLIHEANSSQSIVSKPFLVRLFSPKACNYTDNFTFSSLTLLSESTPKPLLQLTQSDLLPNRLLRNLMEEIVKLRSLSL